ncbi:Permease of the drug/metabolite transporter (DMT) superfamily [Paenibacillus sp. yr247]|uniref:DMT family transporter n=1 Tax=Paenibacillus sp. yr247 TaxID=1761880 RepID=UPI000889BDBC|nr:EamA family transporter [Paenibacillus sp. yr247]SDO00399.1 Permease of the drug/metabolite transporter (DMT) superfamily [Paenibacillus sp. yr247]
MSRTLYVVLFALSLIWGGSFYFIKVLLHDFGPWTIAFLRSSCGLITIVLIMLVLRKPFEWRKIPWIPMAIMASFNTAIPWAIIGFSETKLTSGMASVLNATTPLWTMIVGMLFFQAVTSRLQWIGMGIAFIGLLVLLGVNPVSIISVDLIGFICMIAATLCYGLGSQLSKRLLKGLSMYQITFGTLFCAALGSGSVALSVERISIPHLTSPTNIAVLIGLGVFGSGIAYILFYYMVQKGSPEFATMVTYLVPASAIIWGSTLLNEKIHWSLLSGLAFILGGVFLASKKRPEKADVQQGEIRLRNSGK